MLWSDELDAIPERPGQNGLLRLSWEEIRDLGTKSPDISRHVFLIFASFTLRQSEASQTELLGSEL